MALVIANMLAGFLIVWVLQGILHWAAIKRMVSDPIKSRMIATVCAYVLASVLYAIGRGSLVSFSLYLPGTLIVAWLEYREGITAQTKVKQASEISEFQ